MSEIDNLKDLVNEAKAEAEKDKDEYWSKFRENYKCKLRFHYWLYRSRDFQARCCAQCGAVQEFNMFGKWRTTGHVRYRTAGFHDSSLAVDNPPI